MTAAARTVMAPAPSEPNGARKSMPPSPPRMAPGEVHVWCVRLDVPRETLARLYATLAVDERHRSARLRFRCDRWRFIVAHGTLREVLGHYLGIEPGRVSYVYQACGKPELSPSFGGRLKFNLSHSAGLALIAIAAGSNVGVDLEYTPTELDCATVARHFFSAAEVDELDALPDHRYVEAFLACWTKKEAYVKACGRGLTIPLKSFTVPLTTDPARGPSILQFGPNGVDRARRWSIHTLRSAPGYIGALAIEGCGWRLSQWQWAPTVSERDMAWHDARGDEQGARSGVRGYGRNVRCPASSLSPGAGPVQR
jgi:4'-phosphopantetheinyl transferase